MDCTANTYVVCLDTSGNALVAKCINPEITHEFDRGQITTAPFALYGVGHIKIFTSQLSDMKLIRRDIPYDIKEDELINLIEEVRRSEQNSDTA